MMILIHCQAIVVIVRIVVTAHIDPDRVTIRIRHTILLPQLQEVQQMVELVFILVQHYQKIKILLLLDL